MNRVSRRKLLQMGIGTAIAFPMIVPASAVGRGGKPAPSERIAVGLIGAGGMGRANLHNCAQYPDVVVTAVCDVWKQRLDAALEPFKRTAKGYRDYRELLERPEVDAVIIATPPHWHALQAIHAAQKGKHIYLQKPMTLYPDESLAVRNAVRKHGVITQIGTQIHASDNFRRVVEWVRSGKLGHISVVRTFNVMNQGPQGIGHAPKEPPPADLDWEMWLGPAPKREFNRLLVADAYHHSSFWDYSGGWTMGMGPHIVDLPVWAMELGVPLVTCSTGGRFVLRDDGDVPDAQEVLWQYPNVTMTWTMNLCNSFAWDFGRGQPARRLGIYFHGVNGTLFADYNRHEVVPEGELLKDPTPPSPSIPPSPGHEREWLDGIKTGKQPSCSVEYHYRIDLALTLANVAYRVGRAIRFNPRTERIEGDREAQRLARPQYRPPWKFPEEYLR
jgi:predicted dehydrogenase